VESQALARITESAVLGPIYARLLEKVDLVGSYGVEAKKTSVHITHGHAFLGVHPRSNGLLVNLVTERALESPRVRKSERISANRFHNEIFVASVAEIDPELERWIQSAYALTE
jgi:hypothetical protein